MLVYLKNSIQSAAAEWETARQALPKVWLHPSTIKTSHEAVLKYRLKLPHRTMSEFHKHKIANKRTTQKYVHNYSFVEIPSR